MGKAASTEPGYMPRLDGLRCLAVCAVLPVHFVKGWSTHWYAESGDLGVKLFFVLSGYLIATNLLAYRDRVDSGAATRGRALVVFYLRRMLRLSPVYYAYLAFACLMMRGVRPYLGWFFVYAQNFLFAAKPIVFEKYLAHFWTLAIEEQFYLVVPILILIAPRPSMLRLSYGFILCALLFRAGGLAFGWSEYAIHFMMPAQMDSLGTGVVLAVLRWRGAATRGPRRAGAAPDDQGASIASTTIDPANPLIRLGWAVGLPVWLACRAAGTVAAWRGIAFVFENLALSLALAAVVAGASRPSTRAGWGLLELGPLVYVGRISYGVYVYHFNVPGVLRDVVLPRLGLAVPAAASLEFALFAAVTVVVATVSYSIYERPFMALKRHVSLGRPAAVRAPVVEAAST